MWDRCVARLDFGCPQSREPIISQGLLQGQTGAASVLGSRFSIRHLRGTAGCKFILHQSVRMYSLSYGTQTATGSSAEYAQLAHHQAARKRQHPVNCFSKGIFHLCQCIELNRKSRGFTAGVSLSPWLAIASTQRIHPLLANALLGTAGEPQLHSTPIILLDSGTGRAQERGSTRVLWCHRRR